MANRRKNFSQQDANLVRANLELGMKDPGKFIDKVLTVTELLDGMKNEIEELIGKGYSVTEIHKMLNGETRGTDNEVVSKNSLINYLKSRKLLQKREGLTEQDINTLKSNLKNGMKEKNALARPQTVRNLLDGMKEDLSKLLESGISVADLYRLLNGGSQSTGHPIISRTTLVNYLKEANLRKPKKRKHRKAPSVNKDPTSEIPPHQETSSTNPDTQQESKRAAAPQGPRKPASETSTPPSPADNAPEADSRNNTDLNLRNLLSRANNKPTIKS